MIFCCDFKSHFHMAKYTSANIIGASFAELRPFFTCHRSDFRTCHLMIGRSPLPYSFSIWLQLRAPRDSGSTTLRSRSRICIKGILKDLQAVSSAEVQYRLTFQPAKVSAHSTVSLTVDVIVSLKYLKKRNTEPMRVPSSTSCYLPRIVLLLRPD